MSTVTVPELRGRIRDRLNDMDAKTESFDNVRIDNAIASVCLLLGSKIPAPILYTASAFTISANADTFTLPVTISGSGYGSGTVEYAGSVRIQLASTGEFLIPLSKSEMDSWKRLSPTPHYGVPERYDLTERSTQVVGGRVYPGARAAEACNLYASISPDDLRDYVGTGGTEGIETAVIPGGRQLAQAVEACTAKRLILGMSPAALALRGFDRQGARDLAREWEKEYSDLMWQEAARLHALEATGRVSRRTS